MSKVNSKPKNITKLERFLESLIIAGKDGVNPQELTLRLKTNNITKYPYDLKKKGVYITTGKVYKITNINDATAALTLLNQYRTKRGVSTLPEELLEGWI